MPHSHPVPFSSVLFPRLSSLCLFIIVYIALFLIAAVVLFSSLFNLRPVNERHISSEPTADAENDYHEVVNSETGKYYHVVQAHDEIQWENRLVTNLTAINFPLSYIIQSVKDSPGLRWPYSHSKINCSSFHEITNLEFIASGWTKAVFKGKFRGQIVAIKTVNLQGHDMQKCQAETGTTLTACHRRAAAKILKEIILLTEISHANIIKVLGSCVLDTGPIAVVTEFGEPLDTLTLLQFSWEDRLRLALGIAEILYHLAHSPLGSLSMNDFRRQQFVLVNGILKLSDVDDLGINEPQCSISDDCNILQNLSEDKFDKIHIKCLNSHCQGHNEQFNIWHAGQYFIKLFLPVNAPDSLEYKIQELLTAYSQRRSDTKQILTLTQQLVNLYRSGGYAPRERHLQASHLGFKKVSNSDLPGMFDYRCNGSTSVVGCIKSVFDEVEAAQICSKDPHCAAVILGHERTWTGRTIAIFKNGFALPSRKAGYSLLKKV